MKKLAYLFCFCCFVMMGCSASISPFLSVGADAIIAWKDGEAVKYYDYGSISVYKSIKNTLHKLKINITKDEAQNGGDYLLVAGNGDRFNIRIEAQSNNITRVKIRVNFWGDKEYAELIFKNIEKEIFTINF